VHAASAGGHQVYDDKNEGLHYSTHGSTKEEKGLIGLQVMRTGSKRGIEGRNAQHLR